MKQFEINFNGVLRVRGECKISTALDGKTLSLTLYKKSMKPNEDIVTQRGTLEQLGRAILKAKVGDGTYSCQTNPIDDHELFFAQFKRLNK